MVLPIFTISAAMVGCQMEMLVGIDVIEAEAGRGESGELGSISAASWARTLGGRTWRRRRAPYRCEKCPDESTRPYRLGRQHRLSLHQHQMQPDAQIGMVLARWTASLAAAPDTIRLAADRIPSRWRARRLH